MGRRTRVYGKPEYRGKPEGREMATKRANIFGDEIIDIKKRK